MTGAAMLTLKLRYVQEDVDRHGNVRVYFKHGKSPKVRLRAPMGSDAFMAEYQTAKAAAIAGTLQPAKPRLPSIEPGTWRAVCVDYFACRAFLDLDPRTQRVRRQILEATFDEPIAPGAQDTFATMPVNRMTAKAVRVLRDRKAATPESANGRLKAIRRVFAWGLEGEHPSVRANPARDVPYIKTATDGFHSWTLEEVERYEAKHSVGTKARLALALLLYTGVRRSDLVRLGRQHVRDGWLRFTAHKGRNRHPIQMELPVLPALQRIIDAGPVGNLTFLVTEAGRPFTSNGFGGRMRKWCDDAVLPDCSAHGLRKAGAAIAAENGATDFQLMSIFGWRTIKEAQRYTKAARRKVMAATGMPLLERAQTGTESSHPATAKSQGGNK